MALELNKLTHAVDDLGVSLAQRMEQLAQRLPAARQALAAIGEADAALLRKVQAALSHRWTGAIPTAEPVDARFPLPALPARCNLIAADGSQIYPDRHGVALYYLINIGSIVFRLGVPEAPSTNTTPEVFYADADLYEETGATKPKALIDAERDRRELAELARLSEAEAKLAPTVALMDNGLMAYTALLINDPDEVRRILDGYLAELDRLRAAGGAVAGVVDRPRAANVVRLLRLNALPLEAINAESVRDLGDFEHLTDGMVFGDLAPGERSALFVHASPNNEISYRPRQHTIYFFYLNTGRPGKDELLRVEVPEWVVGDRTRLDLVLAALVEQARAGDGFPYVLMRAHELAVVTMPERRIFDDMITGALIRQRLTPGVSQKAQGKMWTGGGRRR
jgi:hypothetical protein